MNIPTLLAVSAFAMGVALIVAAFIFASLPQPPLY